MKSVHDHDERFLTGMAELQGTGESACTLCPLDQAGSSSWVASMTAQALFEAELNRRGHPFLLESGSYRVRHADLPGVPQPLGVFLSNVQDFNPEADPEVAKQFVDAMFSPPDGVQALGPVMPFEDLYPAMLATQPGRPSHLFSLSDKIDIVLTGAVPQLPTLLQDPAEHGMTVREAFDTGSENLDRFLKDAELKDMTLGDFPMVALYTEFFCMPSLLLARQFREWITPKLGWPVCATMPGMDMVLLWPASELERAGMVGPLVVDAYRQTEHPLSTEVFLIDDKGIECVAEFPID